MGRGGLGIRGHIQENISVVELEGVEPRPLHLLQPLGRGKQMKLLHDLHLVHLHRDGFMFVKSNSRHGKLLLHIVQILPLNDTGNKKRPPCPKDTEDEKTRGTTSVCRRSGLMGHYHARSAVSGAPGAAYHLRGLRSAAQDGNWDAASYLPCTDRQLSA